MSHFIGKAVIPVAGLAARLRPISAVLPKALLPLADRQGRVLPVMHHILAEAGSAGTEQAALVVSPPQEAILRQYLAAAAEAGLGDLPARVEFIVQDQPRGFGQAVWLAKAFVAGEPFLLMLGDHVRVPDSGAPSCAKQVENAWRAFGGAAMIGMQPVGPEELPRVGVAGGQPLGQGVYRCTDFVEKPDLPTARRRLATPGLPPDRFLAHAGVYLFDSEIFDCLEELLAAQRSPGREVQLAEAQSVLLGRRPREYHLLRIQGRAWDVGTPEGYAATFIALAGQQAS